MNCVDSNWAVACDFDGTISIGDATDAFLAAYASDQWRAVEDLWVRGKIGSRECLARQLGCVRASRADMNELADSIEIDPAFASFTEFCAAHGVPLAVISDGLEPIIARVLACHDLAHLPVFANNMQLSCGNRWRLAARHGRAGCQSGTCKCAVMEGLRGAEPGRRLLFVGDGRSDFCAARQACDLVAAKSKLLCHMQSLVLPVIEYQSFADLSGIVAGLLEGGNGQSLAKIRSNFHACA